MNPSPTTSPTASPTTSPATASFTEVEALSEADWAALRNAAATAGWKEARKHDVSVPISDAVALAAVRAVRARLEAWTALP